MKNLQSFKEIPNYKKAGFSIIQTADALNISKNTIRKYWELNQSDIEKLFFKHNKIYKLSKHKILILKLLSKNRMISARKLSKSLFSIFGESYSEKTVSRYLKNLRERYALQKDRVSFK